ncbi:hypothetical protein BCD67_04420 [Oscillatoriales cyanobacterium USR001]|nr:hypothetical protein BCD67_04420 [Oscillatoriales cyanobacterium USR001]
MKKQLAISFCLFNLAILNNGATLSAQANSKIILTPIQSPKIAADNTNLSKNILTLQDLPPGFTEAEVGSLKNELTQNKDFKPESVFAYQKNDDKNFQLILGFTMQIPTQLDQNSFDNYLRQGDFAKAFLQGLNDRQMPQFSSPIPLSLGENIGEISAGWLTKGQLENITMRVDMAVFRRGNLGAILMTFYLDGKTPSIEIAEAARKLDRRIIELNPSVQTQPQ